MSAGSEARPRALEPKKSLTVLGAVGILADIFGLAGGAASVLQRNFLLLTLSIVAVLLVTGSWLQRRRTWLAVGMLATGCLMIGGVLTSGFDEWLGAGQNTAAVAAERQSRAASAGASDAASGAGAAPSTAATGAGTTSDAAGSPATGGDATTGADGSEISESAPAGPQKIVDETVTLPRSAAIDVDLPAQKPAADHTDGATGVYDLYHDWGQYKSDTIAATNGPNTYTHPGGNPATIYSTCRSIMETATPYLSNNGEFCFRTSKGRVAHATVTQTRQDFGFVVHIIVFADPPQ